HTDFEVIRYHQSSKEPIYILWVHPFGRPYVQCAGWANIFARDRESAPVIHFGGPVVAKAHHSTKLSTTAEGQELHLCVGTPGRGEGSFAYVSIENFPWDVHPVAKVRWPGGRPETDDGFLLTQRC